MKKHSQSMASVEEENNSQCAESGKRKHVLSEPSEGPPAKQGRPSKLSPSQKRKLARLYLYTNIKLDDICKIMGLTNVVVKYAFHPL